MRGKGHKGIGPGVGFVIKLWGVDEELRLLEKQGTIETLHIVRSFSLLRVLVLPSVACAGKFSAFRGPQARALARGQLEPC
jgi:hypothetical protein